MRYSPRYWFLKRFWNKVSLGHEGGCWEWFGSSHDKGYGRFFVKGRGMVPAHRFSFETYSAPIPEGMKLDHICHNPKCVNPSHLRVASDSQNAQNTSLRSDNTSGHKGVSWCKTRNKWQVGININGKRIGLGRFTDLEEAAAVYRRTASEIFGEFAFFEDGRLR